MWRIKTQNCGEDAQVIEYVNKKDITVKFLETGVVLEHRTYREFDKGTLRRPKYYVGRTEVMNNSQRCTIVKVYDSERKVDVEFEDGTVVTPALLCEAGLINKDYYLVKILGDGKLEKKLTVQANKFSNSAVAAIEGAGGKTEVI